MQNLKRGFSPSRSHRVNDQGDGTADEEQGADKLAPEDVVGLHEGDEHGGEPPAAGRRRPGLLVLGHREAPPLVGAAGFRASPRVLADAIGECSGFEYVVADPKGNWLVLENHHGVLVAIGEPVTTNLRRHHA